MKYNVYKETVNIVRDFNIMECETYKTLWESYMIDEEKILFELLNDLQESIYDISNKYSDKKEIYNNIKRSTDDLTFIRKGMRTHDICLIRESLLNLFNKLTTARNSFNIQDDEYKIYLENVKIESNNNLINITNSINNLISDNVLLTEANNNEAYLEKVKRIFDDKLKKIIARDSKFVKDLPAKKVSVDVELEVPDDNKVSFDSLMQRYNTFSRSFNGDSDIIESRIKKYQDKNGDLKNGLDNYFRTGSAKKEAGSKKMSGDQAIQAVKNMVTYCNDYLKNGNKISNLINELIKSNNETQTESYLTSFAGYPYPLYEANEKNKNDEKNEDKEKPLDIQHNKQIGITSLMTIAEQRYFDYINALRSLFK